MIVINHTREEKKQTQTSHAMKKKVSVCKRNYASSSRILASSASSRG